MKTTKNYALKVYDVPNKNQLDISVLLQAIQALINNQKITCTFESVMAGKLVNRISKRRKS